VTAAVTRAVSGQVTIVAAAIAVFGIVVCANRLSGPFIFDDRASIRDNPTVHALRPLTQVLSPPRRDEAVSGRPLVNLSLAINYAIGGLDVTGITRGTSPCTVLRAADRRHRAPDRRAGCRCRGERRDLAGASAAERSGRLACD
jgi:hypothetical protein